MIEAKDLRIGNWVIDQDGDFAQIDSGEYIDLYHKEFEPIPLTPEILEKCGFKKLKSSYWKKSTLVLMPHEIGIYLLYGHSGVDIKHLHQLQNLYFALTGEELNVTL